MSQALDRMDNNTKLNIMILDACRNNPFTKKWSRNTKGSGLAQMSGRGAFIGFAASPGQLADDGMKEMALTRRGSFSISQRPTLQSMPFSPGLTITSGKKRVAGKCLLKTVH